MNSPSAAQALCDTIRAYETGLPKTPVRLIDTAIILPHPFHAPISFDSADLQTLALRLRNAKERAPLTVRFIGSGMHPLYQLVAGEKRLAAYRIGNISPVPCAILGLATDSPADSTRFPLYQDAWLEAVSLCLWLGKQGLSLPDAADSLGIPLSALQNKLSLLFFSPSEQALLTKVGLSASCAALLLEFPAASREACFFAFSSDLQGEKADAYVRSLTSTRHIQGRVRDVRLFYNSVDKAIRVMRESGFSVTCKRKERRDATVLTISVPNTADKVTRTQ